MITRLFPKWVQLNRWQHQQILSYKSASLTAAKRFWVLARRFWSGWKHALLVVSPETVVRWHRSGFVLFWRGLSKARRMVGRRRISKEVRDLIFRMIGGESNLGRAAYPRRVAGGAQGSPKEDSYGYERGDGARRTKAKTG